MRRDERTRQAYVYGNTAPKLEVYSRPEPERRVDTAVRKNRDRARYMSAGYVFFLAAALCAATLILVNYIQLQAELTSRTRSVASKESELNSLKTANDEEYNRIISSINLEEIKRIAIGELGMTYAKEDQIIFYTNEGTEYMRPVSENN
ncbi:MAG: cell division protein FtsL [bacterium]|nr:cell division protein FtsL [bacterium]